MPLTRFLDIANTHRKKDDNGYLIIESNPIAKAGVFEYLKSEILPDFDDKSQDDAIVKIFRPFETLEKSASSFANKPIVLSHKWVGDETMQADGAIGSKITLDKENGYLIADLIIYNPELIDKIEKGEIVELSPAYKGSVETSQGRFNGEDYDFIQEVDSVNHLAVVKNGRSGSDLRILDEKPKNEEAKMSKLQKIKDELNKLLASFKDEDVKDENGVQKTEDSLAEKLLEIAGGEGEKGDKIAKINELLAVKDEDDKDVKDEDKKVDDDDKDSQKVCVDGEDVDLGEIKELVKEAVEEIAGKKIEAFQDSLKTEAKKIQDSYAEVSKFVGAFDYQGKSADQIYALGYEALSGKTLNEGVDAKSAFAVLADMQKTKFADATPAKEGEKSKILQMLDNM